MANAWNPFYWADYLGDTSHLTLAEHGAYLLLMAHYYRTRRPLPANASVLHRVCRCTTDAEKQAVEQVLQFFSLEGEVYRHKRIDAELAKAVAISGKRRAAANQRHQGKDANAHANAYANASVLHAVCTTQSQSHIKAPPLEEKVLSCSLEENLHARVSRDEAPGIPPDSPESTPNDLSPFSYGAKICDDLGLPQEGNIRAFGGAIEALIKKGKAPAAAYEFLLARARDAQEFGELTRPAFWCRDGTYNLPAGPRRSRAEVEKETFLARHRANGGSH